MNLLVTATGTRVTARPSLAVALVRAWRTWHEQDPLLPTGPSDVAAAGDRTRVLAELRAARPVAARPHPHSRTNGNFEQ